MDFSITLDSNGFVFIPQKDEPWLLLFDEFYSSLLFPFVLTLE